MNIIVTKEMKDFARRFKCFAEVASIIGKPLAEFELGRLQQISGKYTLNLDLGGECIDEICVWEETPQGYKFWKNISEGIYPYPDADEPDIVVENTCTNLRNVKIDLRKEDGSVDEELSEAFQEVVFESGCDWGGGVKTPEHVNKPFLYVEEDGCLGFGDDEAFFKKDECKQITFTYKRTLQWDAQYVEEPKEEDMVDICGKEYPKSKVEKLLKLLEE